MRTETILTAYLKADRRYAMIQWLGGPGLRRLSRMRQTFKSELIRRMKIA